MIINFSIHIKLRIANTFGKVRIKPTYKHIAYMSEEKFVLPIRTGTQEIGGWPMPSFGDEYIITSEGKKAMWTQGNLMVTRIISWLAILISLVALLINFSK